MWMIRLEFGFCLSGFPDFFFTDGLGTGIVQRQILESKPAFQTCVPAFGRSAWYAFSFYFLVCVCVFLCIALVTPWTESTYAVSKNFSIQRCNTMFKKAMPSFYPMVSHQQVQYIVLWRNRTPFEYVDYFRFPRYRRYIYFFHISLDSFWQTHQLYIYIYAF